MSKTLGQVAEAAYEAVINDEHRLAGLSGLHLVDEEAVRVLDNAWQAAAEAVAYTLENEAHDAALPHMLAREAVIEAAEALVHEQRLGDEASVAAAEWKLANAVDALDSEEG